MAVNPELIYAAVRAIGLIARQVQLYKSGELSEEEFKKFVDDMHTRYGKSWDAWDKA